MPDYERHLEPSDYPAPDCVCRECEGWFYGEDAMYVSNGRVLCPDCFRDEIENLPTDELAELIGADIVHADDLREERKPHGRMRYYLR